MTRSATALVLAATLVLSGCCENPFKGKEGRYRKYLECADHLTVDRAVDLMKRGAFCCEKVPLAVKGREEARRFYLEKALALKPESPEPYNELAISYWYNGQFAKAAELFSQAAERSPRPFSQQIVLCDMQRLCGRFNEALATAQKIRASSEPEAEKAAEYLEGRISYERGDLAAAKTHFEKAIALAGEKGFRFNSTPYAMRDSWFYIAQIRLKSGDPLGAHEAFKIFLEKTGDPDFQAWYGKELLPLLGTDQQLLYDTIESDWVRERQ